MHWQTTRFQIDLNKPLVMGVVNLTPDSFSDGGRLADLDQALRHAEQLIAEGADILDVGAESTRPGAVPVCEEQELARLMPFLKEAIRWQVPISVDTYKAGVMREALAMGADIVNDIWALRQAGAQDAVAAHAQCGICLMHMHREPQSMQLHPMEGDVVPLVKQFLNARAQSLMAQGVAPARIVLDPGIGFGKTVSQNFNLLAHQHELLSLGFPILAGWSRKSALAAVFAKDGQREPHAGDRLQASVAAALLSMERGAKVVRVHDVKATVQALQVWLAVRDQNDAESPSHLW